ncbi:hypothetical protein ONZ45_g15991 [Pleurotus djamor]|nr:hypothetical protein ONZ45_g15991 [Pleurotus djamor]
MAHSSALAYSQQYTCQTPPVPQLSRSQSKESLTPERPKSPWTPSYSVTSQGSPKPEAQIPLVAESSSEEPTILDAPLVVEPIVTETPTAEEAKALDTPDQIERPKSPWTPSYSVTRQGSVPPSPQPSSRVIDIEEITQPAPAEDIAQPSEDISVVPPTAEEAKADSEPISTPHQAAQVPPAPAAKGMPIITVDGTDTPRNEVSEAQAFPVPAVTEDDNKPRLDTVDEHLVLDTTSATLEPTSRDRKRLESTSSSRFFPGGWFSSSPTIEGRTSLENAQGEFAHLKSPIETAAPATTPIDGLAEDEEKRSRWCTIM